MPCDHNSSEIRLNSKKQLCNRVHNSVSDASDTCAICLDFLCKHSVNRDVLTLLQRGCYFFFCCGQRKNHFSQHRLAQRGIVIAEHSKEFLSVLGRPCGGVGGGVGERGLWVRCGERALAARGGGRTRKQRRHLDISAPYCINVMLRVTILWVAWSLWRIARSEPGASKRERRPSAAFL